MNTILEEKEEELRMYTYEPVDSSLGRIMAFRPDTVFPSMVTLSPRSKKLRRQQLRYEAEQDYFAISKAEQLVKKYDRENGLCDSDSNNSDDEYWNIVSFIASPRLVSLICFLLHVPK